MNILEELTQQLAERSIPIWSALAEGLGVDQKKAREMVSDGGVSAQKFFDIIAEPMLKIAREGGALEESLRSTESQANRFANQKIASNVLVNKKGLDEFMATQYKAMNDALKEATPFFVELGEWAKNAAPKMAKNIRQVGKLFESIGHLMDSLDGTDLDKGRILGLGDALKGVTRFIDELTSMIELWRSDASISDKLISSADAVGDIFADMLKRIYDHIASIVNTVLPKNMELETFYQKKLRTNPVVDISGVNALMGTKIQDSLNNYKKYLDPEKLKGMKDISNGPALNGYGMGNGGMMLGKSSYNTTQHNTVTIEVNGAENPEKIAWTIDQHLTDIMRQASLSNPATEK